MIMCEARVDLVQAAPSTFSNLSDSLSDIRSILPSDLWQLIITFLKSEEISLYGILFINEIIDSNTKEITIDKERKISISRDDFIRLFNMQSQLYYLEHVQNSIKEKLNHKPTPTQSTCKKSSTWKSIASLVVPTSMIATGASFINKASTYSYPEPSSFLYEMECKRDPSFPSNFLVDWDSTMNGIMYLCSTQTDISNSCSSSFGHFGGSSLYQCTDDSVLDCQNKCQELHENVYNNNLTGGLLVAAGSVLLIVAGCYFHKWKNASDLDIKKNQLMEWISDEDLFNQTSFALAKDLQELPALKIKFILDALSENIKNITNELYQYCKNYNDAIYNKKTFFGKMWCCVTRNQNDGLTHEKLKQRMFGFFNDHLSRNKQGNQNNQQTEVRLEITEHKEHKR